MNKEATPQFEILEHTADLKVKIFGSSPKELFANAVAAVASVQQPSVVETGTVGRLIGQIRGKKINADVVIESMDYSTLLIDFLNEVLSHSDTESAVFHDVWFKKFSEQELSARVTGTKVNDFEKDIKAVTYHEVDVKETADGAWECTLVFDV